AAAQGIAPIELADRVVARYHELWRTFDIANDDFIRTTEPRHRRGVEEIVRRIDAAGDLYLDRHEGWYCASCEAFYTEKELADGKCPVHDTPAAWQSEENVFFRLSKYAAPLLEIYRNRAEFVRPENRRAEVMSFVEAGLKDISVSRTNVKWGVPFPGRPGHVVYVWLDALSNYVTALGFGSDDDRLYREFWDNAEGCRVHLIGKDILRFHAVYWPAFLLSAGLRLPTSVWAHGWWLRDEKKMSKSIGNVVRPDRLVSDFGPDALRYFLMREMAFGQDASFSDQAFLERFNADLANDLGNTVSRVSALCRQAFGSSPPEPCEDNEVIAAWGRAREDWRAAMDEFAFHRGLESIWRFLSEINGYVVSREPWKIRKEEGPSARLSRILYAASEGVRLAAGLLWPFMPSTSRKICTALGAPSAVPTLADLEWGRLPTGAPLASPEALFPRVDTAEYFANKEAKMAENTAPVESDGRISIQEFQKIRLVTGRVLEAERVPKSNKLVRLMVDLGSERRQVVAGIAGRYEPESLVGRNVVIVANLAPAKLMGVESNGMVLAATVGAAGEPSLLEVPADVPPGSTVK
ncbi:MAG TPA: methionine--tRNA ligase, partial [Thermoanaerobaculia bacterium]|nr:methionine--tRNA ligase [Thermoanaerobaculia bacterium]